jgi:hypothetical protein
MDEITFRFFRSVEGKVVPRYGTATFIGVQRDNKIGWIWDTTSVIRVPEYEVNRYMREYRRALSDGSLVECCKADYDAQEANVNAAPENKPQETPPDSTRRVVRHRKGEEE